MASITPELIRSCPRCSHEITPGVLTCSRCHALIYSQRLAELSERAKILESKGQLLEAREQWLQCVPLLPADSTQTAWIQSKVKELESSAHAAPASENKWAQRLGPAGVIGALLLKGKSFLFAIFQFKFLFSFFAFFSLYWAMFGWKFGLGFAVLILIHEMGHFIEIKRNGLPAELPVFIPGLVAYVRWHGVGISRRTRAMISLAGPLAGLLAAMACAAIWYVKHDPFWAALTHAGAVLNILNLIPLWNLDGGQASTAMGRGERLALLVAAVGLAVIFQQNILYLVAVGAGVSLFVRNLPPLPDRAMAAYFIAVLGLLTWVLWLLPNQHALLP